MLCDSSKEADNKSCQVSTYIQLTYILKKLRKCLCATGLLKYGFCGCKPFWDYPLWECSLWDSLFVIISICHISNMGPETFGK